MSARCQSCSNRNLYKIIDLGKQPPSDAFLPENWVNEKRYALRMFYCRKCRLVQLDYSVDPSVLFGSNYVYLSGFSAQLRDNFRGLVASLVGRFGITKADFAVDIGCNDGTLLEGYKPYGIPVLGVDPSPAAEVAIGKGIPVVKGFFDEGLAKKIVKEHDKAKVITATNVFAHVRDLGSLIRGVKTLLGVGGVFVTESHYLFNLIRNLEYDTIYHEHLRYYSLESLMNLFRNYGMDVFDIELIPTHGGSIRVFSCKSGVFPITDNVKKTLGIEKKYKLNSIGAFKNFREGVIRNRKELRGLLLKIKSQNKHIVGVGAPAKSTTLLNFCDIGPETLDYIVETNNWKVGRYTPGTHIKILHESVLFKNQPEYALLLSWNLKDNIIPNLRENGYKGDIIIPIPRPEIMRF